MPHRRDVRAPELRGDARAETHLGRLLLNKMIREYQYDAGVMLRSVVQRWRVIYGVPRPDRGAMPLDGSGRASTAALDEERACRLTRAYLDAWYLLCDLVGPGGAQLVTKLCVYDEPAIAALDVYRMALDGLAKHWGYRVSRGCE